MARYRILVRGNNLLLSVDGKVAKHGFYTTRFIEADSPIEAERLAIDDLRHLPRLTRVLRNADTDPPLIEAEEITEVNPDSPIEDEPPGLAFFLEGT